MHPGRRVSKDRVAKVRQRNQLLWHGNRGIGEHEDDSDHISALQIVHDAFYYMGFMQLAKYMVFLIMGIVMMLLHISSVSENNTTGYFRTSITSKLVEGYEDPLGQQQEWNSVDSFFAAATYYKNFLSAISDDSKARKVADSTVC
jgi:hypothetical protein